MKYSDILKNDYGFAERISVPNKEFCLRQDECDGHNITQAFNMLNNSSSKEQTAIKAYIKRTLKEMGWTYSKPIKWEKQWDSKVAA